MITYQIEGLERTIKSLNQKAELIHNELTYIIVMLGDETVIRLRSQFKDLTITGQFFPKNLEYWIGISRIGKTVTWIKCPQTNLFFSKQRNPDGSQDLKSNIPTLDIEKIKQEIFNELSLRIKQMLNLILK